MTGPIAYGIDFGTTNSSIAVAYPDRTEVLDVERTSPMTNLPSLVYLHRDGNRQAGQQAVEEYLITGSRKTRCSACELVERFNGVARSDCRQYKPGGGCNDSRLIAEIKSELTATRIDSTSSWAKVFRLQSLASIVLERLKRTADQTCGYDVRRVVVGHPVAFAGAEGVDFEALQTKACERLKDAAHEAGFDDVVLLEEPSAAAVEEGLDDCVALIADFGGGTFDVAVVELSAQFGEVIALKGAAIGGERFSAELFESKVAPALNLDLPRLKRQFSTLGGMARLLSDPSTPGLLRDLRSHSDKEHVTESILYGGHAFGFHKAVEDAKIALSTSSTTSFDFHRPNIDLSVPITRKEFESCIRDDIDHTKRVVLAALAEANVRPSDVDVVLRTGGSSSIPLFISMLSELFGSAKIQERPVYTTVVQGLAGFARTHAEWLS